MDEQAVKTLLAAVKGATLHELGEKAFVTLPEGHSVQEVTNLLDPPVRTKQTIELLTEEDYIAYVKAYSTELENSANFADPNKTCFSTVFDYHDFDGRRGTKDHVAVYNCPLSPEWVTWRTFNGNLRTQEEFARFIEENLADISKPEPATLLEVALKLQVKKGVQFVSEMRLQDGQHQFRYDETIRGTTSNGEIKIPDTFQLLIPVFLGSKPITVQARLRYRLQESKLVIGYELVRAQRLVAEEFDKAVARVRKAVNGPLYMAKLPL